MKQAKVSLYQQVAERVIPDGRFIRTWSLKGGISAEVTALEVEDPDGHAVRMVVRQHGDADFERNPHVARDEFRVLQQLCARGLPVPRPLFLDESGEIFPRPYVVLEYVEGELTFDPADATDAMVQLATCLAQIHSAEIDWSFLPSQNKQAARMLGQRPVTPDDRAEEGRIRGVLDAVWPLPQLNRNLLLHGDFWPGNVLWRNGRIAAVIDWEDAASGDPLADLAISRLEILCAFGPDAMLVFTDKYREAMPGVDFTLLAVWDLCAALRMGPNIGEWAQSDEHEKAMRTGFGSFIAQAFEALTSSHQ